LGEKIAESAKHYKGRRGRRGERLNNQQLTPSEKKEGAKC
jgi:hypothetical protein